MYQVRGAFISSGYPGLGLLFFILPGIAAGFFSRGGEVMRMMFISSRSLVQELAWLLSGVFWCALGALFFLFVRRALENRRLKVKTPSE